MTRPLAIALAVCMPVMAFANGGSDGMTERPSRDQGPDTCGAAQYEYLLGQPYQEAEALEFEGPVRIHAFNAMITMDHLPNRINFVYGPDGMIMRISCG
ncbi:hypothetical protein KUV65_09645 [Maritalea mobilis]|uniref:Peptidase inhibitor I78 family protein n=1 Tax=[Roseibacterium] beibuensis TaxID=1193142 RepID=A0ABP9LGD1_9RHOB|nr:MULTISPECIES: I78 family peptidase inhibitor [Alphaproteobacteria]MBY6201625.1 hypothetical protein [Maritalea mobilis]MCS6623175.1 I78 family peptidase inhibitor [Roseibacterium beibuensis]